MTGPRPAPPGGGGSRCRRAALSLGLAALLALPLGPALAQAAPPEWRVIAEGSEVGFRYTLGDETRAGRFEAFSGALAFDAEAPRASAFAFRIETASIELGNGLMNVLARSSAGLDTDAWPEAGYRMTAMAPEGAGVYATEGVLRIKDREQAVEAPVAVAMEGGTPRLSGRFTLDRRDFALGTGPIASLFDLGEEVEIVFVLATEWAAETAGGPAAGE